jgi:hypothetical protein
VSSLVKEARKSFRSLKTKIAGLDNGRGNGFEVVFSFFSEVGEDVA